MQKRGIAATKTFQISAEREKGLSGLLEESWKLTPEHPHYYPDEEQISDRPMRFFVGEKVREQLFRCLGEELPYSCAVEIERFDESAKPPRIEAVIHVERESQKGMVIGKGGAKIKEIGTNARKEIEDFLGQTVFLGLRVDVIKDWTKDAKAMKRMGYVLP
jgi:GTP-binding protein Era